MLVGWGFLCVIFLHFKIMTIFYVISFFSVFESRNICLNVLKASLCCELGERVKTAD